MTTRKILDTPAGHREGLRAALDQLIAGLPHYDTGTVVATADASDLATSVALSNALKAAINLHLASTAMHLAADGAVSITSADATDLASAQTLLNEMKTDFNLHLMTGTTIHKVGDSGRRITAANASDQTTANALANELKRSFNQHVLAGGQTLSTIAS